MDKCCERDHDNDGNCDRHPAGLRLSELQEADHAIELKPGAKYLLIFKGNLPKSMRERHCAEVQDRLREQGITNVVVMVSDSVKVFELTE